MRKNLLTLVLIILLTACGNKQTPEPISTATESVPKEEVRTDLAKYFQGYNLDGAFVLYDLNADHFIRYNPKRCDEEFLPASTYKIVNALIALETGVATGADYAIKWDGTQYPIQEWNRDHTLRSAMQYSVVWYYVELAGREGPETIQKYVDLIDYGNRDISGKEPPFWLTGNLRITANQQIDLLVRLYKNALPFSKRNMDIVKDILVREKTDKYILRAKTGSTVQNSIPIGWYIGYLEKDSNVYFFATNVSSLSSTEFPQEVKEAITRNILKELGILK
jgi:beta-lactamase class D